MPEEAPADQEEVVVVKAEPAPETLAGAGSSKSPVDTSTTRRISALLGPGANADTQGRSINELELAVAVTASAGHRMWRAAWKVDPRNPSGKDARVKNGEDINVPFELLKQDDNRVENLRAAMCAVRLVLQNDICEADRLHIVHDEWLEANEYARGTPQGVPFAELPPAEQAKDAFWLAAARRALCIDAGGDGDDPLLQQGFTLHEDEPGYAGGPSSRRSRSDKNA